MFFKNLRGVKVVIGVCNKTDCTVATTGSCLISHPDPLVCPHFKAKESEQVASLEANGSPLDRNSTPEEDSGGRTFHTGIELGKSDATELMKARYTHLIGVLGATGVGKTTFLTSLYLVASRGLLPNGRHFAGSYTLQGFEDRARGLRDWQPGALHEHLVDHTSLSDPRQPGLLHLAIREEEHDRRRFDLLLTDLPGEWTNSLVQHSANAQRLEFLRRADGIILVVDGPALVSATRHVELTRMKTLVDRLVGDVRVPKDTPIIVVVSKGDAIGMQTPPSAEALRKHIEDTKLPVKLVLSAAVSRSPDKVQNGTGVFEAIQHIVEGVSSPSTDPPPPPPTARRQRSFQAFRSEV